MEGLETLSEAIKRLEGIGYVDSYRAVEGKLKGTSNPIPAPAEQFFVDEIVRFEGDTNLDDECVLFALTDKVSGAKGLYAVAYGPEMATEDVVIVQRLEKLRL